MATDTTRWTRKKWIAEHHGCPASDFEEYQASLRHRERRLPIYTDGTLEVCVLPTDPHEMVQRTLEGRHWKIRKHWRNPEIIICIETDAAGASPNFDFGR